MTAQSPPSWRDVAIGADLLAAWIVAAPAPCGQGPYHAAALRAVRWCLRHEPAVFAPAVVRALEPLDELRKP